jgi:concanavalin A-like lectin/glucanase superfamily protein
MEDPGMLCSNPRPSAIAQTAPRPAIRLKIIGAGLLIFLGITSALFSAPDPGQKVRPFASAIINVLEIERRERENPPQEKKKVENENSFSFPRALPIPRGAKGETFRVPPDNSAANAAQDRRSTALQSGLEPEFPAIGDNNTTIPPDMGGAVGPNHVMTALNSQVRIQDKSGTIVSTVTLNGFFSPLVGAAAVFDPKVLYDPFAERWIITAPANSFSATSSLLIAVSSTNDPTSPWTGYAFDVDATDTRWFDYPSVGFNKNWIVVTGTLFPVSSGPTNSQVYVFDKAALYAGPSPATVFIRPQSEGYVICPAITLDNSVSTEYLVNDFNPNSGGNGYLRIHTITGTPAAPVYTATLLMPNVNQPWNGNPPLSADFAPQNMSPKKIQNNDSRMQAVVYQNGSLWCAQSAFLPAATPTHTAVQWWQIDPLSGNTLQFGRVEDSTGSNFYAFPSIAVNAYNDVLLGYTSFSAAQFASCNYSFRLHTDPPNVLQPSVQFKAGLAKYDKTFGGPRNRWGDYSSTCIDPDNFSFWTVQEYSELPSGGSDRWGTEWNRVVPPIPNLYVKDRPEDLGAEPDPSTLPMWQSDDIWLRKQQDSAHAFAHIHEDAEYRTGTSNPNYIYVEVRNRGGAPSTGTEQLTLYWAKASSGLSWPDPWNGGVYFDPGPDTMLMGQIIGTQTIPAIAPGASNILEFAWSSLPNPAVYAAAFGPDQNHFCLLVRITNSTSVAGMTFPEITGDLYGNVQRNNRIVWKNIAVYDLVPGANGPGYAVVANLGRQNMNTKLKFTAVGADGQTALLTQGATLKVTVGGKLKQNGSAGDGAKDTGAGTFVIVRDGGILQNIALKPRDFGTLAVVFVPKNAGEKLTGYAVTVTQMEVVGGADRIIGGQTLVFGAVKGFGTSPGGGEGTAGCVPPPSATLVAWYPFDEAIGAASKDLAAGNTAVRIGEPMPIAGMVARALRFGGLKDYVEAPPSIVTNIGPAGVAPTCGGGYSSCLGDFTIDAWIRLPPDAPDSVMTILDKRGQSSRGIEGYGLFLSFKRLVLQLADGSFTNYSSVPLATLADGGWHHIAVTVSRLSHHGITWYHNGVPVNPESNDPTNHPGSLASDSPLRIGTRTAASPLSGWFKGDIDELEIFNRVLTASEVQGIYQAGPAGKCK